MGRLTKWVNGEVWYYTKDDHFPAREMDGYESLIAMNKLAHYEDMKEAGRLMEVVRCKDCAVWRCREDGLINCPYCLDLKKDDDFCSYGVVEGDKE